MLKLKKLYAVTNIKIEIDYYIPIKVIFGDREKNEPSIFWRTGNLKNSLIEIGVGKISGNINSIKLVLAPKAIIKSPVQRFDIENEQIGLPAFEISLEWQNNYTLDEVEDFEIYIINNSLIITFASNKIKSKVVNDRVVFCFDKEKQLCSIEIKDFGIDEMNNLKEYLKIKK